nr:tetratricopeptide repeat protein [uncultured Allomuricauda sp.]
MKIFFPLFCLLFSVFSIGQNNPIDLYHTGNSNFKAGNFEKAIKNYSELMNTVDEPTIQKTCYINRGLSYDRLQKYDLAIEDFTIAIKLDSADMASFVDRGISKMHAGYFEKAIVDFNHVINVKSNKRMTENAIYWKAQIHYSQLKFEETIKDCDQYLLVNPRDPELYFIRGSANSMLRNFEQSIQDYDKAIGLNPNYFQAIANRGTAKINVLTGNGNLQPSKKETKSACKDLKRAKELGDHSVDDLIYVYCDRKGKK